MSLPASDRGKCEAEAGFTLVEALVTITLFSLLSLLVMSSLRFGTQAWQRGSDIAAQIDEAQQVQSMLRRLLSGAAPRFVPVAGGKGYVDFDGRPDSVSFLSDPPRSLDRGGRLIMTLSADKQNGRHDLVFSARPELGASGLGDPLTKRVLLSNIETVTFEYFGAKQRGAEAQWHKSWVRETSLPKLVRIEVAFLRGTAGFWPETVIAPRIDVDVSCSYDTLSRGCKGR